VLRTGTVRAPVLRLAALFFLRLCGSFGATVSGFGSVAPSTINSPTIIKPCSCIRKIFFTSPKKMLVKNFTIWQFLTRFGQSMVLLGF